MRRATDGCVDRLSSVMWICWVFLVLGSVHIYTLDYKNDGAVDLPFKLTQNETSTVMPTEFKTQTQDLEFPYMAAILHVKNVLLGSGAIVGEKWILVTGFQLGAFKAEQLRIRVGSNSALTGGKLFTVDCLYPHPMHSQFNNDLALLRTSEDMVNNSTVQMIAIGTNTPELGTLANFVLWNTKYQVESSEADIVPISECKVFFPDFELTESNICMVLDHILPYSVTLYGSPLVVNMTLIGLYMGIEANTFKPYLCTSLAPLNQWVQQMMANENETLSLFPLT